MPEEPPITGCSIVHSVSRRLIDIVRCVVAASLGFFVITALVLHAPWKITLISAIMFTNLTIIPGPVRKYIDLAICGAFIVMAVWVFFPYDSASGWRPYTFDDELARLEATRTVVPDNKAAGMYMKLFGDYDSDTFDLIFPASDPQNRTLRGPWSDREFPRLAEWLDHNQAAIETLLDAARYEQCRFVLPADNIALNKRLLNVNLFKRWAEVLVRSANRDLSHERNETAMDKICALRRMAGHLRAQQTIFDYRAAYHIDLLAADTTAALIINCEPTEEHLSRIEESLAEAVDSFAEDWPMIFEWEKLFVKNTAGLFYEINEEGRVRHSRNSIPAVDRQFDFGLHIIRRYRNAPRFTAFVLCLVLPRRPLQTARVIDESFDRWFAATGPDSEDCQRGPIRLNYKGFIEAAACRSVFFYGPLRAKSLERTMSVNAIRIMIALKRFEKENGDWPASLDEIAGDVGGQSLIDPVSADYFVYSRRGDDFVLYSKGKNGIDDQGRHNPKQETDDLRLWPTRKYAPIMPGEQMDNYFEATTAVE